MLRRWENSEIMWCCSRRCWEGENGELKHDTPRTDLLPQRKIDTYGRQFSMSRQAFINDDIGLVTSLPARYAAAARRTINRQCYEILMKNPKIYDDKVLFSADHKNLLKTGTGITKEAVQAMIMAISTQKDQFDQAITIRPAMLVLPVGMGFDLFTLFNSPTIQTTDNTQAVNPLYRYGLQQVRTRRSTGWLALGRLPGSCWATPRTPLLLRWTTSTARRCPTFAAARLWASWALCGTSTWIGASRSWTTGAL